MLCEILEEWGRRWDKILLDLDLTELVESKKSESEEQLLLCESKYESLRIDDSTLDVMAQGITSMAVSSGFEGDLKLFLIKVGESFFEINSIDDSARDWFWFNFESDLVNA